MPNFVELFFPPPVWSIRIVVFLGITILSLVGYMGVSYFLAARKFQKIIRHELEGLYPTSTKWPENSMNIIHILENKYSRIENAVLIFKGHLPTCLVNRFNKAWIKYYNAYEQGNWQCYTHYVPTSGESFSYGEKISGYDNTKTYKKNFKNNVDDLLKYARQI